MKQIRLTIEITFTISTRATEDYQTPPQGLYLSNWRNETNHGPVDLKHLPVDSSV
jgi:hypothetical protein